MFALSPVRIRRRLFSDADQHSAVWSQSNSLNRPFFPNLGWLDCFLELPSCFMDACVSKSTIELMSVHWGEKKHIFSLSQWKVVWASLLKRCSLCPSLFSPPVFIAVKGKKKPLVVFVIIPRIPFQTLLVQCLCVGSS